MKYQRYLLYAVFACSYSCIAGESTNTDSKFTHSDKIAIHVHPYEDDLKNFLRLPHRSPERDIRISVKLGVDKVKVVDIIDVNAGEDRCERYHAINVAYLYFDKPVSPSQIYTLISKPCIYQHEAKFKLKVTTKNNEYFYRIQSFTVHPLSDDY